MSLRNDGNYFCIMTVSHNAEIKFKKIIVGQNFIHTLCMGREILSNKLFYSILCLMHSNLRGVTHIIQKQAWPEQI